MKTCTKCKLKKPFESFWRCKNKPDGLQCFCIDCTMSRRLELKKNPLMQLEKQIRSSVILENKLLQRENKKLCYSCKEIFLIDDLVCGGICKKCNMEYYKKNKEKINESQRSHYEKNKEKKREYQREHYEKNKETIIEKKREYLKEYYEKNKEKLKEQMKEYCEKNKENMKKYREKNKEKNKEYMKEYRLKKKLEKQNNT